MIKIQALNIDNIAKEFEKRIEDSIVKNKLGNKKFSDKNELQKRVRKIYLCEPSELEKEHENFIQYLESGYSSRRIRNITKKYFEYETIIDYKENAQSHAYWLMSKLNVNVCPYCNRNYTFTIKNNRPQIDHFYCQEEYPYLSLSFYNLVPSCPNCNHIKSSHRIEINPHMDEFGNGCKFNIDKIEQCMLNNNYNKWNLEFTTHNNNIEILRLIDFYNGCNGHYGHKDFVSEIVFKAQAYNDKYYETLINTFKDLGLNNQEMNLMIFGNYTETEDLNKRPLSKLTKDVLEQLNIK